MRRTVRPIVLAAVVLGGSFVGAHVAAAYPIDADLFKCEKAVSKIQQKLFAAETSCTLKCEAAARAGNVPFRDCAPPYGAATLACRNVAEQAAGEAIVKACTKGPVPVCYADGDPFLKSALAVTTVATVVDATLPAIYCADLEGTKCMDATAKTIKKFLAGKTKCYDKCWAAAQKGAIPDFACTPPIVDLATIACIATLEQKATAALDKACFAPALAPACYDDTVHPPALLPSPHRATDWILFVGFWVEALMPTTYCGP